MLVIPRNSIFLRSGAIVPSQEELDVIIHALIEERDRVTGSGGDRYGVMSSEALNSLITELRKYRGY